MGLIEPTDHEPITIDPLPDGGPDLREVVAFFAAIEAAFRRGEPVKEDQPNE